ncbi:hypothetical protein B6U96_11540 [Archaeoglobales archaeon ex4484_92]|nr:MAG: hypothetical protein B6U96_11540 [Archaeoglobales archaeon ex4484_92]
MEGVLYSLVSALCWAFNGIFYKKAVSKVSVSTAIFHRTIVSAILFGFISVNSIHLVLRISVFTFLILILSAVSSFFLGDYLYLSSLKRCPVSISLPVSSTYPVFVVLISPLVYGASISSRAFCSAALVTISIFVLHFRNEKIEKIGVLLAVLAALLWSLAILSLDYLTSVLPVSLVAFIRMLICLVLIAPLLNYSEIQNKISLGYAGLLGGTLTFIGVFLFITAVDISHSWNVTQPSATSPVISAVLGKVIFREEITSRLSISILMILLAILLLLL